MWPGATSRTGTGSAHKGWASGLGTSPPMSRALAYSIVKRVADVGPTLSPMAT